MSLETLKQIGRIPRQYWRKFNSAYLAPHGLGYWRPLVPAEEFTATVAQSLDVLLEQETISDLGAYLEFGVSRGTSMSCVHRELTRRKIAGMRLVGFDSFEGMPEESAEEGWTPGAYRSTLAATKAYMASQGVTFDNVELVKGWFDQTLTPETKARLGLRKASIINYDCDTYSATKLAMEFSLPLIDRRAVVIFDDWGARSDRDMLGQREAFQELVADRTEFQVEPRSAYCDRARVFLFTRIAPGAVPLS